MDLIKIKDIYASPNYNSKIVVAGWVRAFRGNRFIELNDGSTIQNIQCVITDSNLDTKKINVGSSLKIQGSLIQSIGKGQTFEIEVMDIEILGDNNQCRINIFRGRRSGAEINAYKPRKEACPYPTEHILNAAGNQRSIHLI